MNVDAHFPGRFAPIILANCVQFNVWKLIGVNRVGKCTLTSHSGILVMDRTKLTYRTYQ